MTEKDKEQDKLLDSYYDGIQEYDNALPNWWVWLFIGSVIFGVGYWAYYEFGPGEKLTTILAAELKEIENKKKTSTTETSQEEENAILDKAANDSATLARGTAVYAERCAACHGAKGEGLVGPNLTDNFWIHGNKPTEIKRIVETGVLDKGMLAWKGILPESDIVAVVSYIRSIKGSNPANAKAPQGTEYK